MAFSLPAFFLLYLSALLLRKRQRLEPIMRRNGLDHWVGKRANAQARGYYCLSLCKPDLSTVFQVYIDAYVDYTIEPACHRTHFKSFRHDCTAAGKREVASCLNFAWDVPALLEGAGR
jgi:hypothetical protein